MRGGGLSGSYLDAQMDTWQTERSAGKGEIQYINRVRKTVSTHATLQLLVLQRL